MGTALLGAGIIKLDSRRKAPLFRQIYDGIREAIVAGNLRKGTGLPSSRDLANQLNVSRMTVVNAYDQLLAEGYLTSRIGSGTFVSQDLPEESLLVQFRRQPLGQRRETTSGVDYLSKGGQRFVDNRHLLPPSHEGRLKPFCAGVPALDEFPIETWAKICRHHWREFSPEDLSYGSPAGYWPLRKAICEYVRSFRGVRCEPDQVMVVSGTQQAVDVAARLLLDSGDEVLFEDPGYRTARAAIVSLGAKIVPMPVDQNGAVIEEGLRRASKPRMAYVTPSHQFPMGVTMSIERRIELIEWAQKNSGIIIEDDYDSEYRYAHHPIPSLQGLDQSERTVYVGSFSKVVLPAMSMGYAIVPRGLVEAFQTALGMVSRPPSKLDQIIIHDFIVQGHFGRHLRRMRKVHQQRRTALVEAIQRHLGDKIQIVGSDAGLHCTARILTGHDDQELAKRIEASGIEMRSLSAYSISEPASSTPRGLIFGFACVKPRQIRSGIRKIASLM